MIVAGSVIDHAAEEARPEPLSQSSLSGPGEHAYTRARWQQPRLAGPTGMLASPESLSIDDSPKHSPSHPTAHVSAQRVRVLFTVVRESDLPMPPMVTIITVTYNRAHILPKSVESVLSQDYPRLRLMIVDDGSTDGTAKILEQYEGDGRVEVLRHEMNRGVTAARNTALDHLGYDVTYFGYNDSDDMLTPGAISTAVGAIEAHGSRYSMVYAAATDAAVREPQGFARGPNGEIRHSGEITIEDFLAGRLFGDAFQLVRRDLLGTRRHEAKANGGEGTLWARILRIKPALLIEDVLQLKDRSGADRLLHYRYDPAYAEGKMWTFRHALRYLGTDMRRLYPKQYAQLLQQLSQHAAMAGSGRIARMTSRQAWRMDPSPRMAMAIAVALSPPWAARTATRFAHWIRSRRTIT